MSLRPIIIIGLSNEQTRKATIVARATPPSNSLEQHYSDSLTTAERGLPIRRPRKKRQQNNDARLLRSYDKYDSGKYTRTQFLRAVSHCVMHAEPLQTQVHDDSGDESDRDDSAADTTPTLGMLRLLTPRQTRPTDVKSVYFGRVLVWL